MKRIALLIVSIFLSLSIIIADPGLDGAKAELEIRLDLSTGEQTVIGFTHDPLDTFSSANIQYDQITKAETIDLKLRNSDLTAGHYNNPTFVYWYVYTPSDYTIKVVGDKGLVGQNTGQVIPYTVMIEDKGQFTTDDRGERAIELYSKHRDVDPDFVQKNFKKIYIWADVPEDAAERYYTGKITLEVSAQ